MRTVTAAAVRRWGRGGGPTRTVCMSSHGATMTVIDGATACGTENRPRPGRPCRTGIAVCRVREGRCRRLRGESGTNWGARGDWGGVGCSAEAGVPAVEVVGELVVEDAGADLQQQVGAAGCPAHLLFLDHAFADDLVDRGLGERGGDGLAGAVAFAVVGDPAGVGPQVAVELAYRLEQLGLLRHRDLRRRGRMEVLDGVQGAEDVAVPAEPFQPLQLVADSASEMFCRSAGTPDRRGGGRLLAMLAMTVTRMVR